MRDTPIHLNGPFTLQSRQGGHTIFGRDGVPICEITGQLIDGSGRKDKYPDGMIRSPQAREEEAQFVLDALNAAVAKFLPKSKQFVRYDPHGMPPAFNEGAVVEIKTRDGRILRGQQPWLFVGWQHNGSINDILEYRTLS